MAVLLFGVALFAALTSLYTASYEYHKQALMAGDLALVRETIRLMPENGVQNITLSTSRTVSVQGSPCRLRVDQAETLLDWAECQSSAESSDKVTVIKEGGVVRID